MAIDATRIYAAHPEGSKVSLNNIGGRSLLHGKWVHLHRTRAESEALNKMKGPAVIISSSGMLSGGRILHHCRQRLPHPENTLLITGYQAAGTLGRALLDGATTVRIHKGDVPVLAEVRDLKGLSGHADAGEMMRWLSGVRRAPRTVFVTHGEAEAAEALASRIARERGFEARVPAHGEALTSRRARRAGRARRCCERGAGERVPDRHRRGHPEGRRGPAGGDGARGVAPLVGAAVPLPDQLPLADAGRPRGPHGGLGDRGAAQSLLHLGHGHRGVPRQAGRTRRRAFVVGEGALVHELYKIGFTISETDADFVVLGETRHYNFDMIQRASALIQRGARFVATNPDVAGPFGRPSCGAFAAPIERITGKTPFYVGKPSAFMMRAGLRHMGAHSAEACMVGDNMETDIIAGVQSGTTTVLVLTGVSRERPRAVRPPAGPRRQGRLRAAGAARGGV